HDEHSSPGETTAQAERLADREAGHKRGNYRLRGATLYVTVGPCDMCCGASESARIERVIFGAADPKAGAAVSLHRLLDDGRLNHAVAATGGVLADECAAVLKEFFKARR